MGKDPQMSDLQTLLQDERLIRNIEEARDTDEVTSLISKASEREGLRIDPTWLEGLYVDIKVARKPVTFTREELQQLASRMNTMDSAPKLCHTESCGGNHAGCC